MSIKPKQTLAQNKLLLLYLLRQSNLELSELQIVNIMGELDFMSYFDLKECLFELEQNGHIFSNATPQTVLYGISENGIDIVGILLDDLRYSSKKAIDEYLLLHRSELEKASQLLGEFIKIDDNEYRVMLRVLEKNQVIFEIDIVVYSRIEAQNMVEKWQDNAISIYRDFILKMA